MQNKISNKLVEVGKAIRDEDGNPVFAEVVDYDDGVNKYQGYPAVMIVPDDAPAELGQNTEVHRREGFNVIAIIPMNDDESKRAEDFKNMRTLSGLIRDAIDDTVDLDGLRHRGKDRVLGVVPTSAGWSVATEPVMALVATINVIVRYDHYTGN